MLIWTLLIMQVILILHIFFLQGQENAHNFHTHRAFYTNKTLNVFQMASCKMFFHLIHAVSLSFANLCQRPHFSGYTLLSCRTDLSGTLV